MSKIQRFVFYCKVDGRVRHACGCQLCTWRSWKWMLQLDFPGGIGGVHLIGVSWSFVVDVHLPGSFPSVQPWSGAGVQAWWHFSWISLCFWVSVRLPLPGAPGATNCLFFPSWSGKSWKSIPGIDRFYLLFSCFTLDTTKLLIKGTRLLRSPLLTLIFL